MNQDWIDQTMVWLIGVQYTASNKLALRAGASFSSTPVPDQYLKSAVSGHDHQPLHLRFWL